VEHAVTRATNDHLPRSRADTALVSAGSAELTHVLALLACPWLVHFFQVSRLAAKGRLPVFG
jgi:hypothetical protein